MQDQILERSPVCIHSRLYPLPAAHLPKLTFLVKQREILWCTNVIKVTFCLDKMLKGFSIKPGTLVPEAETDFKNSLFGSLSCADKPFSFTVGSPLCNVNKLFIPNFSSCFLCLKQQNMWFYILFSCCVRNCCRISTRRQEKNSSHQRSWASEKRGRSCMWNREVLHGDPWRSMEIHLIYKWKSV